MKMIFVVITTLCAFLVSPAEARKRSYQVSPECNVSMPCEGVGYSTNAKRFIGIPFGAPVQSYTPRVSSISHISGGSIVSHPLGCPGRAFCGCGASVRVFGHPVRNLYLAANWLRFPRTAPAPGMVAARRGHVFVLEQHLGGNTWMAYDANSGRHATRIHPRSIAGYTIVNPRA
jgi:hypothetical protein